MTNEGLLVERILFSGWSVLEAAYAYLVSELARVYALSQIPTPLEPILLNYLQLEDRQLNTTEKSSTIFIPMLLRQSLALKFLINYILIYVWMNREPKKKPDPVSDSVIAVIEGPKSSCQ